MSALTLPAAARAAWHEMESFGFWLKSPDQFLVAIAATLMAAYRNDELKSGGDVSLLIALLGKLGFSPRKRGALNLPTKRTQAPIPASRDRALENCIAVLVNNAH
jgi:hypothetical protein